jgi:hypothetical protein
MSCQEERFSQPMQTALHSSHNEERISYISSKVVMQHESDKILLEFTKEQLREIIIPSLELRVKQLVEVSRKQPPDIEERIDEKIEKHIHIKNELLKRIKNS